MGGTEMKGMGRGEEFDKELNVTQNKNKSIYQYKFKNKCYRGHSNDAYIIKLPPSPPRLTIVLLYVKKHPVCLQYYNSFFFHGLKMAYCMFKMRSCDTCK